MFKTILKRLFKGIETKPKQKQEAVEPLAFDPEERLLVDNIIDLRNLSARDVMVPRMEIVAIADSIKWKDFCEFTSKCERTRVIIYKENIDQIMGFVNTRCVAQFIGKEKEFNLQKIVKRSLFISPNMRLVDLLILMNSTKIPVAIVIDERGGTDGLITAWHLLYYSLQGLSDIHEVNAEAQITPISDKSYLIDATLSIEVFEKKFGKVVDRKKYKNIETLNGLILAVTDRVPLPKEIISLDKAKLEFEIIDANPRRIKKVNVRKL